jgi:hypothetical protein
MIFRMKAVCAFLAAFATFVSMALPAGVQQAVLPMTLGEVFQPDIYRRDLAVFSDVLQLDAAQMPVLETLYGDYEAAFRASAEKAQDELDALMPLAAMDEEARQIRQEQAQAKVSELLEEFRQRGRDVPPGPEGEAARAAIQERVARIRQEIAALNPEPLEGAELLKALAASEVVIARWQQEKSSLRDTFIGDVQTVLSEQQLQRWPALDRRLRRDRTLSRGRLSGESVNIIQMVNELQLPAEARATLASELQVHELRLDDALRRRNDHLERSITQWLRVMQTRDAEQAQTLADEQVKLRMAVRDCNDASALAIKATLPPELAASVEQAVRMRGYPKVFRLTVTERLIRAASELPDTSPEVQQALQQLEAQFDAELGPLNQRLLAAVRLADPSELRSRLVRVATGGEEDPDPAAGSMEAAFDARTVLGKRYETALEQLLTPDQWKRLPHGSGESVE